MNPSSIAKWASNNHKFSYRGGVNESEIVMDHLICQKSGVGIGVHFLQNCDLPPPLKVFSGPDKMVISSMNQICGLIGRKENDTSYELDVYTSGRHEHEHEKLELLKALRLSQTRAREAEKRAASLAKERDSISKALFEDSLRLLTYRQWMTLLELQVSKLQSQWQRQQQKNLEEDCDDGIGLSRFPTLAFCLGVVGVGFAFGSRYLS